MRTFLKFMFMLWGGIGLLFHFVKLMDFVTAVSVNVGQSSYASAIALIWIGGMVFFGVGSLLFTSAESEAPQLAPIEGSGIVIDPTEPPKDKVDRRGRWWNP